MVIGKSKNTWCFRGIRKFPVEYHNNISDWLTSVIFQKWLEKLDRELIAKKHQIALILDNCPTQHRFDYKI